MRRDMGSCFCGSVMHGPHRAAAVGDERSPVSELFNSGIRRYVGLVVVEAVTSRCTTLLFIHRLPRGIQVCCSKTTVWPGVCPVPPLMPRGRSAWVDDVSDHLTITAVIDAGDKILQNKQLKPTPAFPCVEVRRITLQNWSICGILCEELFVETIRCIHGTLDA